MIRFLIKGVLRDQHRSLFPIIIVAFGVLLTTVVYSFINGGLNELITSNANFDTGHLKIMTRSYSKLESQMPNDLALTKIDKLINSLKNEYPGYDWTARIKFVGLLDVPDENGETKSQHHVFGIAANLFEEKSHESERLNLRKSIIKGRIPENPGEIVISENLLNKTVTNIGQPITLLTSNSGGGMAVQNFIVCGTVNFGIAAMDNGAVIADISDIQYALDMPDGAAEVLGFSKNNYYQPTEAEKIKRDFNSQYLDLNDKFAPLMLTLGDQNGLKEYLQYVNSIGYLIIGIFLFAMSVVLVNAGLMSGIRRYGEVGVRLALGEAKDQIYRSLIYESVVVGLIGSILGTALGLGISFYLQEFGIDVSETMRNSTTMMPNIIRARISLTSYYIGFIPGLLATLIGTSFSGIQIFKRQTATLFKELEV